MASNHTQHYGLCQWEATDAVLRTDFNEDNQKIDTALKTQAGNISDLTAQMANKANTGAVNSLAEEMAQKANQSDLDAAVSRVTILENRHSSDVAALRSENCWVKLSDETLSGSAESYSYSIENSEQYAELKCIYSMTTTNGNAALSVNDGELLYTSVSINGYENINLIPSATQGMGGTISIFPVGIAQYTVFDSRTVGFESDNKLTATSRTAGTLGMSFENLKTVTIFVERGTIQKGGHFILYGLKK